MAAIRIYRRLRELVDVLITSPTSGNAKTISSDRKEAAA